MCSFTLQIFISVYFGVSKESALLVYREQEPSQGMCEKKKLVKVLCLAVIELLLLKHALAYEVVHLNYPMPPVGRLMERWVIRSGSHGHTCWFGVLDKDLKF